MLHVFRVKIGVILYKCQRDVGKLRMCHGRPK